MSAPTPTPFDPLAELPLGTTLLEASAGTGKTFSITSIFLRLVIELDIEVERILVVTFTTAATAELSTRIRTRLGEAYSELERLAAGVGPTSSDLVIQHLAKVAGAEPRLYAARARAAVESFDRAHVSTIHGFCQQILRQHALEANVPFGVQVAEEQNALIQEIAHDFWATELCRLQPHELQLLQLSGVDLDSVRSLVRNAIEHPEARTTPELPPSAQPDSSELIEALDAAAEEARRPGAEELVRAALSDQRLSAYDIDKCVKAVEALGRRFPSDEDREWLAKIASTVVRRPGELAPLLARIVAFVQAHGRWRPRGNAWALSVRRAVVDYARTEIERRARALGQWSFDDMLRRVRDALQLAGPDGHSPLQEVVGARFSAVLIDEFQDTDPVQWEIFDRLFRTPRHRLFLIGDPKQAIYSFRRADVKTYIEAKKTADRIHGLSVNRRSDPPLIAALNNLFSRRDPARVFASAEIGYQPVSAPPELRFTPIEGLGTPIRLLWVERTPRNTTSRRGDISTASMTDKLAEAEITRLVASDIVRTLERGLFLPEKGRRVSPGDMAVLVPKNKHASEVQRALQDLGVPAVIHGPYSVFATDDARELQQVLEAILEPSRIALVKKALVTRLIGVTASELVRMETSAPKELEDWIDRLRQWRDDWHSRSFIEGFRKLLSFRVKDLLRLVDGERRLANLLQLGEILHLTASERGLKAPGLLAWFSRQLNDRREDDKNQVRLETDEPAVQIVTIHKAKGLEYPFVWCPFLWQEPRAPNTRWNKGEEFVVRQNERTFLDVDVDPDRPERQHHARLKLYDLRTEQLRQLYVALTRAKHQVTIHGAATYNLSKSALGYLLFAKGAAVDHQSLQADLDGLKFLTDNRDNDLMGRAVKGLDPTLVSIDYAGPVRKERLAIPEETPALEARRFDPTRRLDTDWRRTSFSGLAAELARTQTFDEERVQAASDEDRTDYDLFAATTSQEILLAELPSGRMIGNCIHKIFELLDFRDIDELQLSALVERELRHFGIDPAHTATLARAVREVLTTPLDSTGFTLSELSREQRLAEMDFVFPTRTDPAFSLPDLIHAFEQHGGPHLGPWLELLRAGSFRDVRGFLSGSIDLAFRNPRDGRYYVLDWKSNHLGKRSADYDVASMRAAMDHHHYHLQYHLYVVAFARYLRQRLTDFDAERHLGGVYYLFVRGMAPSHPPRTGVYFDRPSAPLIKALDEVFTAQDHLFGGGRS